VCWRRRRRRRKREGKRRRREGEGKDLLLGSEVLPCRGNLATSRAAAGLQE
jgi:hypothetical protein